MNKFELKKQNKKQKPTDGKIDKKDPKNWSKEEVEAFKAKIKSENAMWDIAVPERNWTLAHPAVWIMAMVICGLQYYLNIMAKEEEEHEARMEKARQVRNKGAWKHDT